jgi:hemolysin activation/secretion protein
MGAASRESPRLRRAAARAAAVLALVLLAAGGAAEAQQAARPEIDPGQVQKRIPPPSAPVAPAPTLRVPVPAPVTPGATLRFVLTGVVIDGATVFDAAALAPAYESYLAKRIDLGDVEKILAAITGKYRAEGYFLSRAVARPQPLALGILHVTVIEGYVRKIVFRGAGAADQARLAPYFAGIAGRRPALLPPLERALLLANDLPGLRLAASLESADEATGAYDLVLRVARQRVSAFASLDNRGSETLGPWQAQVGAGVNSLVIPFDRLQLSLFDTPTHPSEVVSPALFYDAPLGSGGTRLALSVARTRLLPGGSLAAQDFDATAMRYSARATYPLLRSRRRSLWLGGGFDLLDSAEQSSSVPVFDDHLRVLRGSATYTDKDEIGSTDLAQLELSQGLSVLGASHPGAGLSRGNGRADFTKIAGSLTRQQLLGRHWGVALALAGQKSSAPLLVPEQFALGGLPFGRAYDPAEIAGDDALAGSLELRYGSTVESPLLSFWQLYGFYDLGAIWNEAADGLVPSRASLASVGAGIRLTLAHGVPFSLEIARPLTRSVALETGKPVRVFVSIAASF